MSSASEEATAAWSTSAGLFGRIAAAIGAWQGNVGDRVHSRDEAFCTQALGWTVTRGTGRFGFGTRAYRDSRMDRLAARGKASRDGVQITQLNTIAVRGGA